MKGEHQADCLDSHWPVTTPAADLADSDSSHQISLRLELFPGCSEETLIFWSD